MKYLSGIQLGFEDGTKSSMIEAADAVNDDQKIIEIDPTRTIRAISMKTVLSRNMEGLRLYDKNMALIVDITWDTDPARDGSWTEPEVIPPGQ